MTWLNIEILIKSTVLVSKENIDYLEKVCLKELLRSFRDQKATFAVINETKYSV